MQVLKIKEYLHIQRDSIANSRNPTYRWVCTKCSALLSSLDVRTGNRTTSARAALEGLYHHTLQLHINDAEALDWTKVQERLQRFKEMPVYPEIPRDEDSLWFAANTAQLRARPQVPMINDFHTALQTANGAVTGAVNHQAKEKQGMSRLNEIQAAIRTLASEMAKYERFPAEDNYPVGTVITYEWKAGSRRTSDGFVPIFYTFAVLKAKDDGWYWTGANGTRPTNGDYDYLIEMLAEKEVSNIAVAMPDDFKPLFPAEAEKVS